MEIISLAQTWHGWCITFTTNKVSLLNRALICAGLHHGFIREQLWVCKLSAIFQSFLSQNVTNPGEYPALSIPLHTTTHLETFDSLNQCV